MRGLAKKAADAVGAGLFAALFLTFLIQIAARFIFNRPLPWTDELAVILYIWSILWAAAFMVAEREHVIFDLVLNSLGETARRRMRLASNTLIGVLAACALPASWDYIHFMAREGTPVLRLPFIWVFLPFAFLLVSMVARNSWRCYRLLRG